jgi:hypothetical protein
MRRLHQHEAKTLIHRHAFFLFENKPSIWTKLFDNQLEGLPLLYRELKQFVSFVKPVNQSRRGLRLFPFQDSCVRKVILDVVQQA